MHLLESVIFTIKSATKMEYMECGWRKGNGQNFGLNTIQIYHIRDYVIITFCKTLWRLKILHIIRYELHVNGRQVRSGK
jgi:hypothetical protein